MTLINKTDLGYALKLGSALPAFSLPATDGQTYGNDGFSKDILVVAFTCNHCPYVLGMEAALQSLVSEFQDTVDFVGINSNEDQNYPEDSFDKMKEREINYTYLRDESQKIAKAFGAECTPHFFVFKNGALVYQGRLNDAAQNAGSETTHELKDALDELTSGKDVSVPETSAMGCSIKWLQ